MILRSYAHAAGCTVIVKICYDSVHGNQQLGALNSQQATVRTPSELIQVDRGDNRNARHNRTLEKSFNGQGVNGDGLKMVDSARGIDCIV